MNAELNIGLRQGKRLCRMSFENRLTFISQGLPIILESARGFVAASHCLSEMPREAQVLWGFAEEEAAKILILVDVVRCPRRLISARIGDMVRWYYSHLARLIYADASRWKPVNVTQLREYVDEHRKAHFLEGAFGEYIVPNWNLFMRESKLYADIEAYEDDVPRWSTPSGHTPLFASATPPAVQIAEALAAVGAFRPEGVRILAEVWNEVEFKDNETHADAKRLTESMLEKLIANGLPADTAAQGHVRDLYALWQLPMYHLDFTPIEVPAQDLEREREAQLWAEAGYYTGEF